MKYTLGEVDMRAVKTALQQQWRSLFPFLGVLAAGIACAGLLLSRFLRHSRLLWNDVIHDRSAHLLSGMNLANDLRRGLWPQIFADLDSFHSWPPLHDGVCVGLCAILGHNDERWCILPSLIAWIGSAALAYLLACRACRRGGRIAGLIAALFVLVSPAQRAFATDVMLESLGACLTLMCLYAYILARQNDTVRAYRNLAAALSLLFLEKYNYWLLVVFGLGLDWLTSTASRALIARHLRRLKEGMGKEGMGSVDKRVLLAGQIRNPLNYLLGALGGLSAAAFLAHQNEIVLWGLRVRLQPPDNLLTITYAVLLMRVAPLYVRARRAGLLASDQRLRVFMAWHVWPVAVWFLWPHHLYGFLWVNNPAANQGSLPRHDLFGGYLYYTKCLVHDYHIGTASAVVMVVLFLVGSVAALHKRLRPGATAIFWLAGIAFFLTVHHPLQQSRFLHTWTPALWAGAGIGMASLLSGSEQNPRGIVRACRLGLLGILFLLHYPGLWADAHAPEGGVSYSSCSALDITDAYLPNLADSPHVAAFSNMPVQPFVQWTYRQRYPGRKRLQTDIKGFDLRAADNSACFHAWLSATDCDAIVYLDFAPASRFYRRVPGCENLRQYAEMLQKQTRYTAVTRCFMPQNDCTVTIWKRKP